MSVGFGSLYSLKGLRGDPIVNLIGYGRVVADLLRENGFLNLSNKIPTVMSAEQAKEMIDLIKAGQLQKVMKMAADLTPKAPPAGLFGKAGRFVKDLFRSPEFASITGLLAAGWDLTQMAQAGADAADAIDEASKQGRLTAGAVANALKSLPPELRLAVTGIKQAQGVISGYTFMKYQTQQLLNKTSDPDLQASYQDLIDRTDKRITALSSLLDVMRQVDASMPKPAPKKPSGPTVPKPGMSYQQWLSQSNIKDNEASQGLWGTLMSNPNLNRPAGSMIDSAAAKQASNDIWNYIQSMGPSNWQNAQQTYMPGLNPPPSAGSWTASWFNPFPGMPGVSYGNQPIVTTQDAGASNNTERCGVDIFCGPSHPECCDIHPVQYSTHTRRPKNSRRLKGLGDGEVSGFLGLGVTVLALYVGFVAVDEISKGGR